MTFLLSTIRKPHPVFWRSVFVIFALFVANCFSQWWPFALMKPVGFLADTVARPNPSACSHKERKEHKSSVEEPEQRETA
jgi:hypothetical protein